MEKFCEPYLSAGAVFAVLSYLFLIAALVVAIGIGITEAIARWNAAKQRPAAIQDGDGKRLTSTVPDMVEALKGLLAALATAPLWLALTVAGCAILWVPTVVIPKACIK